MAGASLHARPEATFPPPHRRFFLVQLFVCARAHCALYFLVRTGWFRAPRPAGRVKRLVCALGGTGLFERSGKPASPCGRMLALAAPGSAAADRTPPHSPTSRHWLVHSPDQSPQSRHLLLRMRLKGQEWRFRTPQHSGELDTHLSAKKRGEHRRSRRRHNREVAERIDPTPAPPAAPPAEVRGDVGRPPQDRVFEVPLNVTRSAALVSGCTLGALCVAAEHIEEEESRYGEHATLARALRQAASPP